MQVWGKQVTGYKGQSIQVPCLKNNAMREYTHAKTLVNLQLELRDTNI